LVIKEPVTEYLARKKNINYWEYTLLPDDGNRYEILEGELTMTPAPTTNHQEISKRLEFLLFALEQKGIGKVYDAPVDVITDFKTIFQPDLCFVLEENYQIITEENIQGAPDLIIEILSPSTSFKDLGVKKDLYEKYGVKEYWIVDPTAKSIAVYESRKGKFEILLKMKNSGVARSNLLEDFHVELKWLFKTLI
jgi:Uma2 family endonuclease